MFDLERRERRFGLPPLAEFAAFRRSYTNSGAERGVHRLWLAMGKPETSPGLQNRKQVIGFDVGFVFRLFGGG